MPRPRWTTADMPAQDGRIAIVTGATSGIGYAAALALAGAGARVVLAARDRGRAEHAMAAIRRRHPHAALEAWSLDTASLSSVRSFAAAWRAQGRTVDILMLNAGIAWLPQRQETADGFERQFATNYLGHFALTGSLWPSLRPGAATRIVPVASIAHRRGSLRFDDLQFRTYEARSAYRQSKLAMLMFGLELDRRLRAAGSEIRAIPVHPGIARTAIIHRGGGASHVQRQTGRVLFGLLGQSAGQGALPLLYAATAPDAEGGRYYGPSGIWEARGWPAPSEIAPHACDATDARRLWAISEKLTGIGWLH